jgi:hypothetical protein
MRKSQLEILITVASVSFTPGSKPVMGASQNGGLYRNMATEVHNLLQARILKVLFVKFTTFCC